MHKTQLYLRINSACRALTTGILLFLISSNNAVAYGGYHYGHGYYGHGYHSHYGFHAHYSSHGDIGTGGYVVLGLLGAVILASLLDYDNRDYRGTYHRSHTYQSPPLSNYKPPPAKRITYKKPEYSYTDSAGWNALTDGNADHALDIFAVQSQQDLNSGIPKIGFALAAAANNELDRGSRAMRKALSTDPDALNTIFIDERLELVIDILVEEYVRTPQGNNFVVDNSFMLATLHYLKQDYTRAKNSLPDHDTSRSANNLRKMIDEKTTALNM